MRRYLIVLMMAVILAMLLAACGDDDDEGDDPKTSGRLGTVVDRGNLIIAGRTDLAGFGFLDSSGKNVGFDIDLGRAVAAAIFGDPNAIEVRPISASERGPTIQGGEVDVLTRNVTWTSSRDAQWGKIGRAHV